MDSNLAGARLGIYVRASDDDEGTETSVTGQTMRGKRWAAQHGITDITRYCDNDLSASWYARRRRGDFERLVADIEAGKIDLIWFWTLSRSQRDLEVYVRLRKLCRAKGVNWVVKNRVYDLNDPADLRALGNDAVNAEVFSLELSENVKLGKELAAAEGRPQGPLNYGYRRIYDERGRYVEQIPDDTPREAVAADGTVTAYSPAGVVKEIIKRIADGDYVARIARSLNDRGIPTPRGGRQWSRVVTRDLATNPAYIGRRVHQGQVVEHDEPCWPPLVDEETFWRAQAVLAEPGRTHTKPGRGVHLLSYIARCECGDHLEAHPGGRRTARRRNYQCRGCYASISADALDELARRMVDAYLAREDVLRHLAASRADDPEVAAARAEVARLRAKLDEWRALRDSGEAEPLDYVKAVKPLRRMLADAQAQADTAALPSILRSWNGDWDDIPRARQVVAAVADIRLKRLGKGRRAPAHERVVWRWLIGPDAVTVD